MTFFKGHPLGFLHPVNIIKTLPNNEEKGLRASQLKKPAKPEKERVRGFKGSRGRVVLLESFFKSEKRKSQRIPNQRNQRNQIEGWKVRGLEGWQKTEVGRQKTEVRRQKSEVRRQKTEDRRQKTEDRRQKTEVRRQKSEVRSQKSEDRSQKSEVRRQRAGGVAKNLKRKESRIWKSEVKKLYSLYILYKPKAVEVKWFQS
jgi:hypothetical protein